MHQLQRSVCSNPKPSFDLLPRVDSVSSLASGKFEQYSIKRQGWQKNGPEI